MNELDAGLYSALTGDATLMALIPGGVHKLRAPLGTESPVLIFHREGSEYEYTHKADAAWADLVYIIKAVAEGYSTVPCYDILDRVEVVLKSGITVSGHTVANLQRTRDPAEYVEDGDGGKKFMHVASEYDVMLT